MSREGSGEKRTEQGEVSQSDEELGSSDAILPPPPYVYVPGTSLTLYSGHQPSRKALACQAMVYSLPEAEYQQVIQ